MTQLTDLNFNIEGMHCAACVRSIETAVGKLDGVQECRVNLATRSASVRLDPEIVDAAAIMHEIDQLGFKASEGRVDVLKASQKETARALSQLRQALIMTAPLLVVAMWSMITGGPMIGVLFDAVIQAGFAAAVLLWGGRAILFDALKQLGHFSANMNSLIAMGTLAAFGWSIWVIIDSAGAPPPGSLYFESVGMIISLILVGRYLEARSRGRAGEAIKSLLELQPNKATAIVDDHEVVIDAAAVQPGMILIVRPGERVPADGIIIEGRAVLDESLLTGESLPVEKDSGDEVYGGTLNGNMSFRLEVGTAAADSVLANIVRMVSEAQSRKAPVQKLADRVSGIFVPTVIGLAVLTGLVWYYFDPASPMLIKCVVSVLIIACPCALGLATPTAILTGSGRAAREGIIIRGGDILEELTRIDTIVFDKTGTLTHGQLELIDEKAYNDLPLKTMLQIAGSAESQSEHPVADAIVRRMRQHQIPIVTVTEVEALPGFGLKGIYAGKKLLLGNQELMENNEVNIDPAREEAGAQMSEGRTTIFVALDDKVVGLIALADRIRNDAKDVVVALKNQFARVTMLSGDAYRTAAGVARSLNLDEFEAEIKPAHKKLVVESYRKIGFTVAMVGDGINDAPALAAANVGIAIGSGTDIAIESADVVLVRSELSSILRLFETAKVTMKIIRQNLFWAFFYNIVAIPIAAGALYPLTGLTLAPWVAATAMAFSSVFVVTNSLRLNRLDLV
ncbi:MAG TPA: heavy metal translocating P-type ATPase [candidate division Zixibacteria bacterium]|nr:heavy metal translocating P-type ATPase [candidate division Zixibacteria bacterium]